VLSEPAVMPRGVEKKGSFEWSLIQKKEEEGNKT
jgi:hypothetical protein